METFGPQRRAPESWKGWLLNALGLHRRRTGRNVILAAGVLFASYCLLQLRSPVIPVFAILASGPLMLGLFADRALRADEGAGGPRGSDRLGHVLLRLVVLGFLSWTFLACLFTISLGLIKGLVLLSGLESPQPLPVTSSLTLEPGLQRELAIASLFFVVAPVAVHVMRGFWFLFPGWFFVPLLVCARLPMAEAYVLSRRGERANQEAVFRVSLVAIGLLALVGLSGGILSLFVLPLLGALQYVSYRDVFLGRRENAPAPVRLGQPDLATGRI